MERYRAPEKYRKDESSGLYYKEEKLHDAKGNLIRHIIWFNAETGEYKQTNELLSAVRREQSRPLGKMKRDANQKKPGKHSQIFAAVGLTVFVGIAGFIVVRGLALGTETVLTTEQMVELYEVEDWTQNEMSFEEYDAVITQDNILTGYEAGQGAEE